MALYIDSAYLDDIREVARTVRVAGVTTNPTILLAARERGQQLDPLALLKEMLSTFGGAIFIQSGASDEDAMFAQAIHAFEQDWQKMNLS